MISIMIMSNASDESILILAPYMKDRERTFLCSLSHRYEKFC